MDATLADVIAAVDALDADLLGALADIQSLTQDIQSLTLGVLMALLFAAGLCVSALFWIFLLRR